MIQGGTMTDSSFNSSKKTYQDSSASSEKKICLARMKAEEELEREKKEAEEMLEKYGMYPDDTTPYFVMACPLITRLRKAGMEKNSILGQ